ncbi:MAG: hypothetical protein NTZ67_03490 [Gammaproteobacteria bacterium]|nr:hypothetical protein [Gammaproteobacteria bacterium]
MEVAKRITAWIMNFDSTCIGYDVIIVSHFNAIAMAMHSVGRVWPGKELIIQHTEIYSLSAPQKDQVYNLKNEKSKISVVQAGMFAQNHRLTVNQNEQLLNPAGVLTRSDHIPALRSHL